MEISKNEIIRITLSHFQVMNLDSFDIQISFFRRLIYSNIMFVCLLFFNLHSFSQNDSLKIPKIFSEEEIESLSKKELRSYIGTYREELEHFEKKINDIIRDKNNKLSNIHEELNVLEIQHNNLSQVHKSTLDTVSNFRKRINDLEFKYSIISDSLESLGKILEYYSIFTNTSSNPIKYPSDSIVNLKLLEISPQGFYFNDKPYTGYTFNIDPNNQNDTVLLGYLENGLKNGKWFSFDVFNRFLEVKTYLNGIENGPELKLSGTFDKSYNQRFTGMELFTLFNNVDDFVSLLYLVNDKLPESSHIGFNSIEITNFERGLKNGEINKIINNHIVFGSYKNDTVNGKWLEYTLGGYGQMESMFENGEILNPSISESKYYKEINYEFGVKNGVYESYTNGIIRERIYYKDDKYDGNYEIYDSNGNLITLKTYSEGKEIK